MLPCSGCAYRESIPGDEHSRCVFDWLWQDLMGMAALITAARITPKTAKWFQFPYNYDPTWGPDTCPQRADARDPEKLVAPNPLADILSVLGGRR